MKLNLCIRKCTLFTITVIFTNILKVKYLNGSLQIRKVKNRILNPYQTQTNQLCFLPDQYLKREANSKRQLQKTEKYQIFQ
jgi:hypothetical protein